MTIEAQVGQPGGVRERYGQTLLEIRGEFEAGGAGDRTVRRRSDAVDLAVTELWAAQTASLERLRSGVSVVALGGYGRQELFPFSDVDLLFLLDAKLPEREIKDAVRRVNQQMWDCGIRVAPQTRRLAECEQMDPVNVEFTLSLLDHRPLVDGSGLARRFGEQLLPKLLGREHKAIVTALLELTHNRHAKYGNTLFHLEPNVKECPGGLRDINVCAWMQRLELVGRGKRKGAVEPLLDAGTAERANALEELEFAEAKEFLRLLRCFLHYRHERDDNTLDWQAQDRAAERALGLAMGGSRGVDAAYWMRVYFRQARTVERRVARWMAEAGEVAAAARFPRLKLKRTPEEVGAGFHVGNGRVVLDGAVPGATDPAEEPEAVLGVFRAIAETGLKLSNETEARLSQGLPALSAHIEEGPALWTRLSAILKGPQAATALRSMHALGLLDLLLPEFHGIDALVIRDAYHRYTVDEHTFVLIETLHALSGAEGGPGTEWPSRFAGLLRELQHPELLYLGALLHDTGKGRSSGEHATESAKMAKNVLERLEIDPYETGLVLDLIRNHLEMSAALRRDIFDSETVRAFASKVQTPEALRMLTLFTYADLNAVHPDALTPWKAENLWRLYIATANALDRSVDEERVSPWQTELVDRVAANIPGQRLAIGEFLEGFPERYVRTRSPEQIRLHFEMAERALRDPVQLHFRHAHELSELTLVTPERALLFANLAGALTAWGMNIVTADAFSNRRGVVVDTFRFLDTFRTLEMNAEERPKFVAGVREGILNPATLDPLLSGRRRARRRPPKILVEPTINFNDSASAHSTLMEVTAQDTPGLLHALSLTLAGFGCSIEVALVDTEGDTAIDVFYLTRAGGKLGSDEQTGLRSELLRAMGEHAR